MAPKSTQSRANPKRAESDVEMSRRLDSDGLTMRQVKFIQQYTKHWIGARAAREAGYSPHSAEIEASRLLRNVKVKAKVDAERKRQLEFRNVTQDRIVDELVKVAFFDPFCLFNEDGTRREVGDLDENQRGAFRTHNRAFIMTDAHGGRRAAKFYYATQYDKLRALDKLEQMVQKVGDGTQRERLAEAFEALRAGKAAEWPDGDIPKEFRTAEPTAPPEQPAAEIESAPDTAEEKRGGPDGDPKS